MHRIRRCVQPPVDQRIRVLRGWRSGTVLAVGQRRVHCRSEQLRQRVQRCHLCPFSSSFSLCHTSPSCSVASLHPLRLLLSVWSAQQSRLTARWETRGKHRTQRDETSRADADSARTNGTRPATGKQHERWQLHTQRDPRTTNTNNHSDDGLHSAAAPLAAPLLLSQHEHTQTTRWPLNIAHQLPSHATRILPSAHSN